MKKIDKDLVKEADDSEKKIKFMKNILDYSYPSVLITKVKELNKSQNTIKNKCSRATVILRITGIVWLVKPY